MSEASDLKREFELDRMIFFSDAVFAIAITLLVIDIKFPEIRPAASSGEVFQTLKPMVIHFSAFVISFIFIASIWSRHLRIFRYLRTYDKGLIVRNLVLMFFIVCFPFIVSGFTENLVISWLFPCFFTS